MIKPFCCTRFTLLTLFVFLASVMAAEKQSQLTLRFFGSSTCGECMQIKDELLNPFVKKNPSAINLIIYDIDKDSDLTTCLALEKAYGIKNSSPQELFFPDTYLIGFEQIMKNGPNMIAYHLANPKTWTEGRDAIPVGGAAEKPQDLIKQKLESFSIWGMVAAGLLDGINPCAIATLVFLVSFLTVQKRKRSEILVIGIFYTITVYITYLLMGIGALGILTSLIKTALFSKLIKWAVVIFALVVAFLSFRDAFIYKLRGNAKEMKLQLPKVLKLRIHKIISQNLSGTQLVLGTVIAGFLVTILEAVCTGQFYIPVLTAMAAKHDPKAIVYLLFYNLLFVLPLLIVMIMAFFGMKWEKLAKASQRNLVIVKTLLGVMLMAMAAYLLLTM